MRDGYDEPYEDELFDKIAWPSDGYRLFEIGHFIGDGDWFDGTWESNCLFVPRKLLEQVGGFDEGFAMAGGGYTNLEIYERLASSPDVQVATIIGEGSFHQLHGGTTTNLASPAERRERVFSYGDHYAELRGRALLEPREAGPVRRRLPHRVGPPHPQPAHDRDRLRRRPGPRGTRRGRTRRRVRWPTS